jgi:cytochrome P450
MLHHRDVLREAQREIDSVIGHERLPDFSDEPQLHYVKAVLAEVIRWRPVVPLGAFAGLVSCSHQVHSPTTSGGDRVELRGPAHSERRTSVG